MNTIKHFHNIAGGFDRITGGMSGLEAEFKYVAPVSRTRSSLTRRRPDLV